MSQFQPTRFNYLPTVIKNLLILNGLMYLATRVFPQLIGILGLYFPTSPNFEPYQIITHMFTHGSLSHVFFNMFTLWMFGAVLENVWGAKRFLIFYMITGLGAAILHLGVNGYQLYNSIGTLYPDILLNAEGFSGNYSPSQMETIGNAFSPTVGASGAVYGILVAFGMLFPNTMIFIYFLLPIKAKYLISIFIGVELYLGFVSNPSDNIAHFAHLGGALFGFLLVKFWGRNKKQFY